MKFHPVCEVFPPMSDEEFAALKADIKKNGVHQPVETFKGTIIDGRNRWRACEELGVACPTREWNGSGSLVDYVAGLNLHRRHLTAGQRAMLGDKLRPLYEEEARRREKRGTLAPAGARVEKSAATAAKAVGSSTRSVERASKLRKEAPDEAAKVERGEKALNTALRDAKKKAEPPKPVAVDKEGHPIEDPGVAADFARRAEFEDLGRRAHALKREIQALAAERIGQHIHLQTIEGAAKAISDDLLQSAPYSVCPYPSVDGHKTCRACRGLRWVRKTTWHAIPEEIREAIK